jgi:hypothetical protein
MFANNMKNILIIFFLIFLAIPQQAFSATYDKKVNTNVIWGDGNTSGRAENEGFFGNDTDSPNCKKFNYKLTGLRQGQSIFYNSDGKIHSIEKGIFDCKYNNQDKPAYSMYEGLIEFPIQGEIQIFFKNDSTNSYIYMKRDGVWYYSTRNIDFGFYSHPKSNFNRRIATDVEIQHANRLYLFYKNINLSSPSAKIYNIINTDLNPTVEKKRVVETRNENSSTYWSNTKDGPTDIESAKKKLQGRKLDLVEGIWYGKLGSLLVYKDAGNYKVYLIEAEDRRHTQFNGTWEATIIPISSSQYTFYSRIWYFNKDNKIEKFKTQKGRIIVSKNSLETKYDQLSEAGRNMDETFARFWPQDIEKYNINFAQKIDKSSKQNCSGNYSSAWNNCYSSYTWPSGDKYDGYFVNGKRTGYGTYTWANGNQYVGNFIDSRINGRGTYSGKNGDKYIGEYKDGKRHGNGTYIWNGGDIFTGEFREDEMLSGVYTYSDGRVIKGNWKDGKYAGSDKYQETKVIKDYTNDKKYESSGKTNSLKNYWWVLIILIGAIIFVYTQTKGDLQKNIKVPSSRNQRTNFSNNYFIKFFYGKESLVVSFWIMFVGGSSVIISIIFNLKNVSLIGISFIFWLLYYVYSVIGTWRSTTLYKTQQISKREDYGWATATYIVLTLSCAGAIFGVVDALIK